MNVHSVLMESFFTHQQTRLGFPEFGIVTVVGGNGSGKSSIIEAVSFGLWGRTLRGSGPWPPSVVATSPEDTLRRTGRVIVEVNLGDAVIGAERRCASGRATSGWASGPRAGPMAQQQYDTVTKAQAALEERIGTWDVWRRTHVFSSQDAAHFSTATDKDRKLLLESILGLDRFDHALARARDAARAMATKAAVLAREADALEAHLVGAVRAREDAQRRLDALLAEDVDRPTVSAAGDPGALEAEAWRVAEMAAKSDEDARRATAAELVAVGAAGSRSGELRALRARIAPLDGRAECPTCEQPVPQARLEALRAELRRVEAEAREQEAKARADAARARHHADDLADEAKALRKRVGDLRLRAAELRAAIGAADRRAKEHEVRVAAAKQYLAEESKRASAYERDLTGRRTEEAAVRAELAVLAAVDDVLNYRGVRAHVLAKCLTGLEASASAWLTRLAYDMMVLRLLPYTEKKSGGLTEAISVRAGRRSDPAPREYDSLSGGERRRVDVSILLALSEAAAAAHGRTPGTLFFDEVFDALDPDGVAAVSEALNDLAQTRCVVVISHNPALVEALPAVARVCADAGKLLHA